MNKRHIIEIEELRGYITSGYWTRGSSQYLNKDAVYAQQDDGKEICVADMIHGAADLDFIATAPQMIDTLLEEIERLELECKKLGGEPYCKVCNGTGELEEWPSMHDPNPGIEVVPCHACCGLDDPVVHDD